jgi:putative acetyltransferase
VDQLRAHGEALVSLVAELGGEVVGYILLSPVAIEGNIAFRGAGMAPLAVLPAFQRRGVGTRLTQAGLEACRAAGCCRSWWSSATRISTAILNFKRQA